MFRLTKNAKKRRNLFWTLEEILSRIGAYNTLKIATLVDDWRHTFGQTVRHSARIDAHG